MPGGGPPSERVALFRVLLASSAPAAVRSLRGRKRAGRRLRYRRRQRRRRRRRRGRGLGLGWRAPSRPWRAPLRAAGGGGAVANSAMGARFWPESSEHRRQHQAKRQKARQHLGQPRQPARQIPDQGVEKQAGRQNGDIDGCRRNLAHDGPPLVLVRPAAVIVSLREPAALSQSPFSRASEPASATRAGVATRFGKRMTKPLSVTRRLAAPAFHSSAAMVLTGANVALGKAIVAEVPIYLFMLFRFLLSTAALLALVHWEPGPKLRQMRAGQVRDLTGHGGLGHDRLYGADV